MLRLGILLKRTLAPAAVCALALSACGSQQKSPATTTSSNSSKTAPKKKPPTVYIYSSLPRHGSERSQTLQIEQGIRLALPKKGSTVNGFRIAYAALSDSPGPVIHHHGAPASPGGRDRSESTTTVTRSKSNWSPFRTVANAQGAAQNPQTIAYIGDLDSGATALSLPILNQAGIVQITPGSGYAGLTNSYNSKYGINQSQGEPAKYYPQTSVRTLLRLIPSDVVQASAALDALRAGGCQRFSAWRFGDSPEAKSLFNAVLATAPKYQMTYKKAPPLSADTNYINYVDLLKPDDLRCAVMVGHVTPAAVMLTTELRFLPTPTIIGTSGFCSSGWIRGISDTLHKNSAQVKNVVAGLYCTTPARPVTEAEYPSTPNFIRRFVRAFRRAYHRKPLAYDYYGYVAAELVIKALQNVGLDEDARQEVRTSLFENIPSVELDPSVARDTYGFDNSGDLDSDAYGVDHFGADGVPAHYKTVMPDAAHLLTPAG
jgi:branched-chain amino acid transport system substrate-binding protein